MYYRYKYIIYVSSSPKHVLTDRPLQYALYQQEKEILNTSETDSIYALFSIAKIYVLSRFGRNNVRLVDFRLSKLYMFYNVASETIYGKGRGEERENELRERSRLFCICIVIY